MFGRKQKKHINDDCGLFEAYEGELYRYRGTTYASKKEAVEAWISFARMRVKELSARHANHRQLPDDQLSSRCRAYVAACDMHKELDA